MIHIKKSVSLVLAFLLAFTVSGCNFNSEQSNTNTQTPGTAEQPSQQPAAKKVLRIYETDEVPTLDTAHAHDSASFAVLNNSMEGLYRRDPNSQPYLAMAEKHDVSPDSLVHTFTIRSNAKWSNGDPVTAHDFEYAWKRVYEEAGHYSFMFETAAILHAPQIQKGEKKPEELGVKALDERTLEVKLEYPNPLLNQLLSFPTFFPQKKEFVESQKDKFGLEYNTTLYNGPFMLTDWKHEQGWTFEKNPHYWETDKIKVDQIDVYVVKDVATALTLYESGQLDRVSLNSSFVDQYRDKEGFTTIKDPSIRFLRFNHTHPALANANIRRAINMAWDKEGLTNVILNDGATPLYGVVPGGFFFSPEGKDYRELNGEINKGTVEQAQELWKKGLQEVGVSEVKVALNLADTDQQKKVGEFLKNQLEKNLPGFTMELKSVPTSQRLELEKAITYDISISSWGPDYSDPMTYLDMWVTGGSANRMKYSNPKYDEMVKQAKTETDLSKRFQIMLELEKMLLVEDVAIAPLYQEGLAILQRPTVKDYVVLPTAPKYNYQWVDIVSP
ncbi:peptide ABC transporter substrate-binding protein [Brevibacillus composti]|uniref:Peptide ABC transporter substrate-binding protein n=1 Tax=Brevibacillus composti TaxID=2796470 RepID=A0A7T5JPZ4_9BACL|nr:peptide ABC transporter substrate-binding protein [Brevibacillus composti]QQE75809.1 peptide ABC transporter substrate-binding protein [Brevibacillus composti]QUO42835.1 peptide ABC transporter substrate-binding protein [Brevibacillus composti]